MAGLAEAGETIAWLRRPDAVRERCETVFAAAEADTLRHFAIAPARLEAAAEVVAAITRETYPDLDVPVHGRQRQFGDRWAALFAGLSGAERARATFDLVVTSVLLDAGAGAAWRYRDPQGGALLARSEGLAVASLRLFAAGALSARAGEPLRADAAALAGMSAPRLGEAFQVGADNPLVGLEGRAEMLRRLGDALGAEPEIFGTGAPRVGAMYDTLAAQAEGGALSATRVFAVVMRGLAGVWPRRLTLAGINLGDVGRHPAAATGDATSGLVPFHKLSQWLAYSLVEPLAEAGVTVTGLDALTGLAEYRNGGLFLDTGVLVPKHAAVLAEAHAADSEIVVEWRALTVALLDRLAVAVRERLGVDAAAFPLAKVLEGGSWRAGRRLAAERRADGAPPLRVISDGTLF